MFCLLLIKTPKKSPLLYILASSVALWLHPTVYWNAARGVLLIVAIVEFHRLIPDISVSLNSNSEFFLKNIFNATFTCYQNDHKYKFPSQNLDRNGLSSHINN